VLEALELEIIGRNLPPGEAIGKQITTLRKKKGISQRELVKLVGVSQPTLIELERHSAGRLQTLDNVLTVLGAAAYLAPKGATTSFYTHQGNSSNHHGWETPQELLERLYEVFGVFDLDPCAPTRNRRMASVKAKAYFKAEDDGLNLAWYGNVFVNPPYGRALRFWVAKAHGEVVRGNAQTVVMLIPARTDTKFWHEHIVGKAAVFVLKGRLKFGGADQSAPFPSAIVAWGASDDITASLQSALPDAWLTR
jgi:phage N-6-adenine-methyltransferase